MHFLIKVKGKEGKRERGVKRKSESTWVTAWDDDAIDDPVSTSCIFCRL